MIAASPLMQIVLHYAAGAGFTTRLSELASQGLAVSVCPIPDRSRFDALMADAEVLWHLIEPVTAATLAAAPRLRLIQKIGVGVNTIDLAAAQRHGVAVCNMPGTNTQAVAEMTLLLMLGALRMVAHLDSSTRAGGGWALPPALQDRFGEIHGRTSHYHGWRVGLIGFDQAIDKRFIHLYKMTSNIRSRAEGRIVDWYVLWTRCRLIMGRHWSYYRTFFL